MRALLLSWRLWALSDPWRAALYGAVLACLLAAAAWPYAYLLSFYAVPVALGLAAVGYLPRRRWAEAFWLAGPAAAAAWIEPATGTRVMAVLALPIFVATLRPRFAAAAATAVTLLLVVSIRLKIELAGTRLTWQDVKYFFLRFADNVTVLSSQPTLVFYGALVSLVLATVLYGSWAWDRRHAGPIRPAGRAAASLAAVALFVWTGTTLHEQAMRLRQLGAWNTGLVAGISAFPLSRFLESTTIRTAWVERDVPTAAFARAVQERVRSSHAVARPADVALFLQESQFNPATVAECPPSLCRLPVFGADAATRGYGPLRVHVFGAGTWLSEFTAATGVPHSSFGEGGEFAPFNVAPGIRRSFVRSMRDAGYRTVAVYPVPGGMMNARAAYRDYGFDSFYDSQDLRLQGGWAISDEDMHAAARRVLENERAHGKPVLLFVVTIFNHSEHGVKLERVPPALMAEMKARFPVPGAAELLADYVWRTQEFERAWQRTAEAVFHGARPAVLAWFGDHQPIFSEHAAVRSRMHAAEGAPAGFPVRMQTWYHVGTNVPGVPGAAARPAPLDIAFLPGVLAEAAGVRLDEFLAANVTAREQCRGLLRECARPEARDAYLSYVWRDLKAFELP